MDDVLAHMSECRLRYAIPVSPQSRPSALASWLERRGFVPGYAWVKFARPCGPATYTSTDMDIRIVNEEVYLRQNYPSAQL